PYLPLRTLQYYHSHSQNGPLSLIFEMKGLRIPGLLLGASWLEEWGRALERRPHRVGAFRRLQEHDLESPHRFRLQRSTCNTLRRQKRCNSRAVSPKWAFASSSREAKLSLVDCFASTRPCGLPF